MRKLRFNIASLLLVVSVVAVGVAALRESSDFWDSVLFTLTLGVLLIAMHLAIHRTDKRRAFWLGFGLFGSAYLGLSLIPSIESRLITTKGLSLIDSKVRRSNLAREGLTFFEYDDGRLDQFVVNNSQPNSLYLNKGNGKFQDVTAIAGLNQAPNPGVNYGSGFREATAAEKLYLSDLAGRGLGGSRGTTENFIRIGQTLLTLIVAFSGGWLSRHWYDREHRRASGARAAPAQGD
jgi:hypothetical protein